MPQLFNGSSNTSDTSSKHCCSGNQTEFPVPMWLIVPLSFMWLLIVIVNGLVIFLIHKKKTLRTKTNMFLTSLALSDLMSGLVGIPLLVICSVSTDINVCVSSVIFIRFTAVSSVCHVLLIACDRYIFIIYSMKYYSLVTKGRAIVSIITIWLFSVIVSIIQMSWYVLHDIAWTEHDEITVDHNRRYSLACIVLFFAVPLLLMCYIYGRIFYVSLKRKECDRQLSNNSQQPPRSLLYEWRGRSVLLIAMIIFAGCWLPFFLVMLSDHMESSEPFSMPVWVQRLLMFLAFIPPMLNPILCTLAKKDFRRAFKQVILQCKMNSSFADFKMHQEQMCLKPLHLNENY